MNSKIVESRESKLSIKLIPRDVALIAIFAALWTVLQIHFGPLVGRFSIGPFSFHGSVNRMVGWLLMTVLADQTKGFGKITLMTATAAFGTRVIRANPLEGLIVGTGYVLGGFIFDSLINIKHQRAMGIFLAISTISGLIASIPYLLSKIFFLGLTGFIIASPIYMFSTAKGLFFSLIGSSLGVQVNNRFRNLTI